MWARITRGAVAVAVVVGVTSCETGVFDHPGGDTPTERTTTTRPTGKDTGRTITDSGARYGWFLPEGPDLPGVPEHDVRRLPWSGRRAAAATAPDGGWVPTPDPLHHAAVHPRRPGRAGGTPLP